MKESYVKRPDVYITSFGFAVGIQFLPAYIYFTDYEVNSCEILQISIRKTYKFNKRASVNIIIKQGLHA
jgi:hypothetical protein